MRRREFGTIRRLPSGRWQASYWCDGNRHFAPTTFNAKRNAGEYLAGIETELQRGEWIDPLSGRILFAELAREWTNTIVDLRPSTKARDLGYLGRYVLPRFGQQEVRSITHPMVRAWVAELVKSGLAPSTTTKAVHILSKILRFAVQARVIPSSPCDGIRLPRIERTEMRFLTAVEVEPSPTPSTLGTGRRYCSLPTAGSEPASSSAFVPSGLISCGGPWPSPKRWSTLVGTFISVRRRPGRVAGSCHSPGWPSIPWRIT